MSNGSSIAVRFWNLKGNLIIVNCYNYSGELLFTTTSDLDTSEERYYLEKARRENSFKPIEGFGFMETRSFRANKPTSTYKLNFLNTENQNNNFELFGDKNERERITNIFSDDRIILNEVCLQRRFTLFVFLQGIDPLTNKVLFYKKIDDFNLQYGFLKGKFDDSSNNIILYGLSSIEGGGLLELAISKQGDLK